MVLPASVIQLCEYSPAEDVGLLVLRKYLPDVPAFSLIPRDLGDMGVFLLVRRITPTGFWSGHDSLADEASLRVMGYVKGIEADRDGALLLEAVRVAFRTCHVEQHVFPGVGSLARVWMEQEPVRRADWDTSAGPVQYADLPAGWQRYEMIVTYLLRPTFK